MCTEVDCLCVERRNIRGGDQKREKKGGWGSKKKKFLVGLLHYRFLGL